jgi:membrane protease YdiL (CAAX protease family)
LGVLLTVWSPAAFGLTWGSTWTRRWFIAIVGGGMTLVAAIGMLFIRVPFYGGTMAIYFVIPFEEELLFRGFLFAVLDDAFPRSWSVARLRFRTATLVTAVAFGLWHLGGLGWPEDPFILFQVFYTAIAGFLFALMRERTGSLWAPWLTHTVVNAWAVHVPGFWK